MTLKDQNILERWFAGVHGAQGKGEDVLRDFVSRVQGTAIPGLKAERVEVTRGVGASLKGIFGGNKDAGKPRDFIRITNEQLEGYAIYAGTRDYGKLLLASWYLLFDKSSISRHAKMIERSTGGLLDYSELDLFQMEEMSAFTQLVHSAFTGSVEDIMKDLNLDFTKIDTHTKGFLNLS